MEQASIEASVPLAAFGIEDLDLGSPAGRPEPVAGDGHLRSLADDVATEPDPGPPRELQPQPGDLGQRSTHRSRQARRLQHDEQRVGSPGERPEAMQPIGQTRRTAGAGSRGRYAPLPIGREICHEEVDGVSLEQAAGHRQAFVDGLGDEDHEPLEIDAPGNRLDRVEAAAEIEPGDDGTACLGLGNEPEGEGGLAARMIAANGESGLSRNATGAEDRVEGGKSRGYDPLGRLNRRRLGADVRWIRVRQGHGSQCSDDVSGGGADHQPSRSCGSPAIPEGRQGRRDVGGGLRHRPMIEQMFYSSRSGRSRRLAGRASGGC